ncbi:hypothetical protein APHAL10511_000206 [Amanita phalloides]|nr:hypothetical protein APHAL10511_000206 [Amanita phalloides]
MDPPRSMPDKTNKKVSRACNTCRLKRKKCNGLDPCLFCTENKVECSYSREPRRRGPPSGYLRYTETRVALFEILLGLFISRTYPASSAHDAIDPFYDAVETLLAESKSCTQDVWDGHRRAWTVNLSSKMIDDLAMALSPYSQRPEQEAGSRRLLPSIPPHTTTTSASAEGAGVGVKPSDGQISPSFSLAALPGGGRPRRGVQGALAVGPTSASSSSSAAAVAVATWAAPVDDSGSDYGAIEFSPSATRTLSRESFERGTAPLRPGQSQASGATPWQYPHSRLELSGTAEYAPATSTTHKTASGTPYPLDSAMDLDRTGSVMAMPNVAPFDEQDINYAGSYWRSVDLAMPDSPDYAFAAHPGFSSLPPIPSSMVLELPPPDILSKMVDVYYSNVWPTFPFLPTRPTVESLLSSMHVQSEAFSTVLLALCAYCGRLSPSCEDSLVGGDAGIVAADLWYEQARTGVYTCIRKGSSVEVAQALLLLALTDHGKGNETQAWIFVGVINQGMAVRVGQDMDLNGDLPTTYAKKSFPMEEVRLRRNIWSVSLMLDLFLSLQLGRPPASFDCLHSDTTLSEVTNDDHPVPIFLYAAALCRTIARINLHLYLGYDTPQMQSQTEKLGTLKHELERWHQLLPTRYQIVIGHQPDRSVLELNMLYHVAVILLYRPFCRENVVQRAMDTLAEAASAFNGLLEKYRQIQNESMLPTNPPLSLSNPNMIYIIFTVAIAHLSGFRMRHPQAGSQKARTTAITLQTQLHLLNCLEALTSIGVTWRLARRCWRTLDKLMEVEGLKPPRSTTPSDPKSSIGKRKREGEDVIGDVRRQFPGGPRDLLPGVHVSPDMEQAPLPTFGTTLERAEFMATPPPQNVCPTDAWGVASSSSPFQAFTMTAPGLPLELINSMGFSSARWLSDIQENDSIGLGIVWNGEWDEQLWTRTMNIGLDTND